MIPVLFGVAFLVFTILSLTPGDPGTIILGITAKPEDVAALNAQFGYDKSFLIRFFSYIGNIIFHFDLGTSYASRQPVINDIGLAALALLVAESDPAQKDTLIRLIMNMLAGPAQS